MFLETDIYKARSRGGLNDDKSWESPFWSQKVLLSTEVTKSDDQTAIGPDRQNCPRTDSYKYSSHSYQVCMETHSVVRKPFNSLMGHATGSPALEISAYRHVPYNKKIDKNKKNSTRVIWLD